MKMQQEKSIHKPMLDVEGQVQHLKDKGITFQLVNDEEAKEYLRNNNYYFKLTSYRKNYDKYIDEDNEGKYISLDFGYLRDLAIIDMDLRYMLAQLSFDIEHYIMGPLSRPRSKILRVAVSRIILSSEASKVKLVGNLVA